MQCSRGGTDEVSNLGIDTGRLSITSNVKGTRTTNSISASFFKAYVGCSPRYVASQAPHNQHFEAGLVA